MDSGVIRLVLSDSRTHPYYRGLLALRERQASRSEYLAFARPILEREEFSTRLRGLHTPLWTFVDRLGSTRTLRRATVEALVSEVFGRSCTELGEDPEFAHDEALISDALVLVAVAPPPGALRPRLLIARRAIALIQLLAHSCGAKLDVARIERLLRATILLPATVFPIPNVGKDQTNRAHEAEGARAARAARAAEARALLDELATNDAVTDELARAFDEHRLASLREDPAPVEEHSIIPTLEPVLSAARAGRLSDAARGVVERLDVSLDAIDVPAAVDAIERRNIALTERMVEEFGELVHHAGSFGFTEAGECDSADSPEPRPANDFTPDTRGKVEIVGTQDLMIVRQRLLGYRKNEIAHVENVLRGERKSKTHRKLHRSEISLFEENEREQEIEDELQTTDKYELQTETTRVIHEDRAAEAGVTVTASYGPVSIEAHGSYALNTSLDESRSSASTFARDVVSRSVRRVHERVLRRRSRTDINEVEVINEHEFDNVEGQDHVTGVYRWLDKRYEAQILNYGRRAMLEFMIPSPAAFYKYAKTQAASRPDLTPPPRPGFCNNGTFHPLKPTDIRPDNYMYFVAKYMVKNAAPPAPRYIRVSGILQYKVENTKEAPVAFAETNDSFAITKGYVPKSVSYAIAGGNGHSQTTSGQPHDDLILVVVTIGSRKIFRYYKSEIGEAEGKDYWTDLGQVIEWGRPLSQRERDFGSYSYGSMTGSFAVDTSNADIADNPETVPVSLTGHTTLPLSASVHYTVLCERSPAKHEQWQLDTFAAIQEAYASAKQEYDAARQHQELDQQREIAGVNPARNRELEQRELKKFSVSLLTGQQFESFNAMVADPQLGIPQIDLPDAAAEGTFVRFFEQALEWRHMTYLFYPYFWANRSRWAETINTGDEDPLFEQFLQAGYARVWVPVRPGFELVMAHYIQCGGEPWTDKDAPLCEAPEGEPAPLLSLIDELREQLGVDFEVRPGLVSVTEGQTLVIGDGTNFGVDDIDREILIARARYRIAEVDEVAQQISLRSPYPGVDQAGIGYGVGAKLVGEPWEVEIPTSLVVLDPNPTLILD